MFAPYFRDPQKRHRKRQECDMLGATAGEEHSLLLSLLCFIALFICTGIKKSHKTRELNTDMQERRGAFKCRYFANCRGGEEEACAASQPSITSEVTEMRSASSDFAF